MSETQTQTQTESQPGLTGSAYFALEVERYKALNKDEVCAACFCSYVRNTLKLQGTDHEILLAMAPHYYIWSAAWKAKS